MEILCIIRCFLFATRDDLYQFLFQVSLYNIQTPFSTTYTHLPFHCSPVWQITGFSIPKAILKTRNWKDKKLSEFETSFSAITTFPRNSVRDLKYSKKTLKCSFMHNNFPIQCILRWAATGEFRTLKIISSLPQREMLLGLSCKNDSTHIRYSNRNIWYECKLHVAKNAKRRQGKKGKSLKGKYIMKRYLCNICKAVFLTKLLTREKGLQVFGITVSCQFSALYTHFFGEIWIS